MVVFNDLRKRGDRHSRRPPRPSGLQHSHEYTCRWL